MRRGQVLGAALVGGAVVGLLYWERRRPLRDTVEAKPRHDARNAVIGLLARLAIQHVEEPVVAPVARSVERRGMGLLPMLRLPACVETIAAAVLMDYTLYIWHVLTHKVPFLWRFHQPHHVDRELSASTGIRFHFGELILSTAWRAAQVAVIGVRPRALRIWQRCVLASVLFHHANIRIPPRIEKWLARVVVTPRLHGIHHSTVQDETDSNWSSGLSIWDRLHGTYRDDVPQERIAIGVPACHRPGDVRLLRVLGMPLGPQRPAWRLPDGRRVRRTAAGHLAYGQPDASDERGMS
ncbi:MAG: sterol desaturase family protein [Planctomycetota bacterium]